MIQQIKIILVKLAAYYRIELTAEVVAMYAEDLSRFTPLQVVYAVNEYRRDAKNKFYPLPAQLIEILEPPLNEKSEALEAVSKIWEAVGRFGWPNATAAKESIGELGWKVVQKFGGWGSVCDQADASGGILRAQMRELAVAMQERAKAGRTDVKPSLPEPTLKRITLDDLVDRALSFHDSEKKKEGA